MSQEFTIAALTFTIVMVCFNIFKDLFIIPKFNPSEDQLKNISKRWYISFGIGIILLYIMYA